MAKVNDLYNKANRYLKRNGIEKTAVAVADTALSKAPKSFKYQLATTEELKAQKAWVRHLTLESGVQTPKN